MDPIRTYSQYIYHVLRLNTRFRCTSFKRFSGRLDECSRCFS